MALPREYVAYFCSELAVRLGKSGKVKLQDKTPVSEKIQEIIQQDIAKDEKLNQEVRDYLEKYSERIRRDAISFQEMYKLVKRELQKKYKI